LNKLSINQLPYQIDMTNESTDFEKGRVYFHFFCMNQLKYF